jgi:hypothetical protein
VFATEAAKLSVDKKLISGFIKKTLFFYEIESLDP